ncbi:MAG: protein kinase [Polyangiaceae bacterium]|nr:protein kinase [Polyangiaceae bacterium]
MSGPASDLASRLLCIHCGGTHPPGMRRCPSTGRCLGGDPRLIGQLVARRYRVLRVLGEGLFGAAYKAEHVTVGRLVSLRILRPELVADPAVLNRFLREARLVGSVAHERLQPLVDAGLSDDGLAYVAYQYARGRSLARAFAHNVEFNVQRAATILCEVLDGLNAIHESGFVHRALMPDSVLLQPGASGVEHALLSNFGAATFEYREGDGSFGAATLPRLFSRGPYTLPAQALCSKPDRREDIFAAGVLLAATLSPGGIPRFGGDLIALDVPPTIEAIIARATHPNIDARYSSAKDMRSLLRPFASLVQDDPASVTETVVSDLRILRSRERVLDVVPARLRMDSAASTMASGLAGAFVRALKEETGARWTEILHRVPGLDRMLPLGIDGGLVPATPVMAALEEADALCGTDDRLFCMLVGEAAGHRELNDLIQTMLGGAPTPEFLFDALSKLWPQLVGQGVSKARQVGRGYGRFEVRDQLEPSFAVCSAVAGVLKAGLEHLGAHTVEVSKTACEAVGDPACVFNVSWSS